jgi:P-type Cu2+ transporter
MRPSSQRPASSASGMPLTGSRLVQLGMAVSRNPAIAVDVSRTIADVVFQGASLNAVTETLAVARRSGVLVRQNIALAILYNALALPVAMAGWVTPLLAALAMSSSSVLVIANAFRAGRSR